MAKMLQETLIITVSKLVKDNETDSEIITDEIKGQLDAVLAQLVDDDKCMIEITPVDGDL